MVEFTTLQPAKETWPLSLAGRKKKDTLYQTRMLNKQQAKLNVEMTNHPMDKPIPSLGELKRLIDEIESIAKVIKGYLSIKKVILGAVLVVLRLGLSISFWCSVIDSLYSGLV